jgi:hypothetical protein
MNIIGKKEIEFMNAKPKWYVPTLKITATMWKKVKSDYRIHANKKLDKKHPDYIHTIESSEEITRAASFLLDNHTKYGVVMFSKLETACGFYISYPTQCISNKTKSKLDLYMWNQQIDNELKYCLKAALNK